MTEEKRIRAGDLDSRTMLYTELNRTGGDPSFLFELLEGIVERRDWENLLDESGKPVGSLRRLIEAPLPTGCGQNTQKILALLNVEHRYERNSEWGVRMKNLRTAIEKELNEPLAKYDRHESGDADTANSSSKETRRGKSRDYIISRLQRERPDLAEKVASKEISANAAAIKAGFRKKRATIYPDDTESTAKLLTKHMSPEQIDELIQHLTSSSED